MRDCVTNFLYATNFPIDSLANSLVSLNLSINAAPAKFLIIVYKIDDFGYFNLLLYKKVQW